MKHFFLIILLLIINNISFASETLLKQLKNAHSDTTRLRLYSELAKYYKLKQKPDSSILYVNEGLKLGKKLKNSTYDSNFYMYYGLYLRYKKQLDSAIYYLHLAQNMAMRYQQNNDIELSGFYLAVAFADRASRDGNQADHISSINQLFENLQFSQKNHSLTNLPSLNYGLLSGIYRDYNNDSLAYYYLEKALDSDKRDKNPQNQLYEFTSKIELNLYHKNLKVSRIYLDKILNFKEKNEIMGLYMYNMFELVSVYLKFGDYNQALELAQLIQNKPELFSAIDDEWKMRLYVNLTSIYLKKLNVKAAADAHQTALIYSKKTLVPFNVRFQILKNQEKLLESQGRFEEALKLNKSLTIMQDSLFSVQNSFVLATSEERFKSNSREQTLKQKLQLNQLKTEKNRQITITIIVLLSIIALIILLIWQREKKTRKILQFSNQQLESKRKELEYSNATKDKLFSIISHDLRSPIANLQTLLWTNQRNSNKRILEDNLPLIQQKITIVRNTLDNLLLWSTQQFRGYNIKQTYFDIKTLVEQNIQLSENTYSHKSITILNQITSKEIYADENKLDVVIRNILGNAMKFTPNNGFIKIYNDEFENYHRIIIQDSGIGMDATTQENLFKNFKSKVGTEGETGSGLGLFICKELIELQNGKIEIESQLNEGTTVKILLPIS